MIEFFLNIIPPETTHQQKKVHVINNKPEYSFILSDFNNLSLYI